jgi:uncharacterized protein (UPF0332 family)
MREKVPDKQEALSLLDSAKKDLEFTFTLNASEDSANTIIRNIYECFRMLGEALLINKGISTSDHIMMINEIINLDIETSRPLNLLDNLRRLRHNINYYAYRANKEEAKNILSLARDTFYKVFDKIKEVIEKR